ncbi:MAG: hypothetical protein ACNI27_08455 [Desulfovibrio sp.]
MANPNEIDVNKAHEAINACVVDKFPEFKDVSSYAEHKKRLPEFGVDIQLNSIEPSSEKDSSGRLAVKLRWEMKVYFRSKSKTKMAIRGHMANLCLFVHDNQFGIPCMPTELIGAFKDEFSQVVEGHEAWNVEFEHTAFLGKSAWEDEGETPKEILSSYAPLIGEEDESNKEFYKPVTP